MSQSPEQKFTFDDKFKNDMLRAKKFLEYLQDVSERGSRADDLQLESLNMARTPCKTLYSEGSSRLLEYEVLGGPPRKTPILMIYSFINRWYILDLQPGHSFIEALSKAGFKVYMLDWGIPGPESSQLGFEYYLEKLALRAVKRIRRKHSGEKINLFGYCLGGTLAAIMAALHPEEYASQVLLTTPLAFKGAGILSLWTNKEFFDPAKLAAAFGCIPEEIIHAPFPMMKPKDALAKPRILFDNILNDSYLENFKSIDRWATDNVPFPGKVFKEFIGSCYQDDLLAMNQLKVGEAPVDLSKISAPTLNIFASNDHIVPAETARLNSIFMRGSKLTDREYPLSHLTVTVAHPMREKVWEDTVSWYEENNLV
ncbi:MAG: alpha/beta fold hydrolase [Candidatus Riflebacteria bacterium]|nr:alpha/beta fold hydrolase [Candidatus Riflebacteria bacterium]